MAESIKISLDTLFFNKPSVDVIDICQSQNTKLKTNCEKELADVQKEYEKEVNKIKAKYAEIAKQESLDNMVVNKLCSKPLGEQILITLGLVQRNNPISRVWDGNEEDWNVFDDFFKLYINTIIKEHQDIKPDLETKLKLREVCKACFEQEAERIRRGYYGWISKDGDVNLESFQWYMTDD